MFSLIGIGSFIGSTLTVCVGLAWFVISVDHLSVTQLADDWGATSEPRINKHSISGSPERVKIQRR